MTVAPPAFLRVDRPELEGDRLVVRAVPLDELVRRRTCATTPLGYLYAHHQGLPAADLSLTAGHYDEEGLVWSYTGELTGLIGLTEPFSDDDRQLIEDGQYEDGPIPDGGQVVNTD